MSAGYIQHPNLTKLPKNGHRMTVILYAKRGTIVPRFVMFDLIYSISYVRLMRPNATHQKTVIR
jgi:hypothetical protein